MILTEGTAGTEDDRLIHLADGKRIDTYLARVIMHMRIGTCRRPLQSPYTIGTEHAEIVVANVALSKRAGNCSDANNLANANCIDTGLSRQIGEVERIIGTRCIYLIAQRHNSIWRNTIV